MFVDSSDHYVDDNVSTKYTDGSAEIRTGRTDNGIRVTSTALRRGFSETADGALGIVASNTVIMGGACYWDTLGSGFVFNAGYMSSPNLIQLGWMADGRLTVSRDFGTVVLAYSDAAVIQAQVWHYIEWLLEFDPPSQVGGDVLIHLTRVKVWRDGEMVINTGLSEYFTVLSAPALTYAWTVVGRGPGQTQDDFYVADGSGGAPWNTAVGDITIMPIRPDGAGDDTDWTPSPAVANYLNVDDVDPDEDSTYNYTDTVADTDLFTLENIAGSVDQVLGVQVLTRARRTDEGTASIANVIKHDGVEYEGHEANLQTSYTYSNIDIYEQAPDATDWDVTKVNALQAGYRRKS